MIYIDENDDMSTVVISSNDNNIATRTTNKDKNSHNNSKIENAAGIWKNKIRIEKKDKEYVYNSS